VYGQGFALVRGASPLLQLIESPGISLIFIQMAVRHSVWENSYIS